jgi:hypothetical protein
MCNLPMVNYPFYERPSSPFKYSFDGWRCAMVLDAGEGRKEATVFMPAKLQVVKVDPAILATKAKAEKVSVEFQRTEIAKRARTFRLAGISYDRKATVLVLKSLGATAKAIQQAATPATPPPPAELTLTIEEAIRIRKQDRMFFKALGLPMAEDSKVRRQADVQVTFAKGGQRVEQMQMGF